ncbi:MAG: ABC transporter substrate-binding protein [Nitrospirales bacterium]|nr:MAG: ABC transporter substrate-binding protein [Nitrospirales bacterium]
MCIAIFLGCHFSFFPPSAVAQSVVIVQSSDITSYDQTVKAFLNNFSPSLRQVERLSLHGDLSHGEPVVEKIRSLQPSFIVAVGLKAALVVRQGLPSIPSMFCMVLDPAKYNLTKSRMAGIALEIPFKDQIQSLQEVLPSVKRVGVIYNARKTGRIVKEAASEANALGMKLIARVVSSEKDVPASLRAIVHDIDALWLLPDSTVVTPESFDFLLRTTLEANVPVIGFSADLVRKGALLSVHFNYEDVGKQAARLAEGFLEGHQFTPGVILSPEPLRLAINLKTANFLGITVSPNVLDRVHTMY